MNKKRAILALQEKIDDIEGFLSWEPRERKIATTQLKFAIDVVDQLDEPEITEEQAWEVIGKLGTTGITCAENERTTKAVEIPQFVGDWIANRKAGNNSLIWSLAYGQGAGKQEVLDWLCECSYADKIDREEKILKAWELGYTIEPPKTLQVIVKKYDSTVFKTDIPEGEAMKLIEGWKEDAE